MAYMVKETFYTLQGEGAQAGRAAVFCRFAGCNLWSGRESDRATAECTFCDTDFVGLDGPGGGKFETAEKLAAQVKSCWVTFVGPDAKDKGRPYVVLTGGEPLLQVDEPLITALHDAGFEIAIESNGTLKAPPGIDWICISPKGRTDIVQTRGDELKLVYPQKDALPERFADLDFKHFFLQPLDGLGNDAEKIRLANTEAALDYCRRHPQWRLSLQTHKILGIP